MFVAFFSRYEERCIAIHSNKTALNILIEVLELIGSSWDLVMEFETKEDSFKVHEDWSIGIDYFIERIEDEIKDIDGVDYRLEKETATKLLTHFKDMQNDCKKLECFYENTNK